MHSQARYLEPWIRDDFKEKMVFFRVPLQVGKTTIVFFIGAKKMSKFRRIGQESFLS